MISGLLICRYETKKIVTILFFVLAILFLQIGTFSVVSAADTPRIPDGVCSASEIGKSFDLEGVSYSCKCVAHQDPTCKWTVTPRVYTIKSKILCPTGTVLTRNVRPFYSFGIQDQDLSLHDPLWSYGNYSTDIERTTVISSNIADDTVYYGLESDLKIDKKNSVSNLTPAYFLEPVELIPTGLLWATNMDGLNTIYAGTWFNPLTNMTSWRRNNVVTGTYYVDFVVPTPYDTEWCVTPTSIPDTDSVTITTDPLPNCSLKTEGDANCDDKIDLQDLEIWQCQVLSKSDCSALEKAADFDLLNNVNINDFEIWRKNYYKKDIGNKITPV